MLWLHGFRLGVADKNMKCNGEWVSTQCNRQLLTTSPNDSNNHNTNNNSTNNKTHNNNNNTTPTTTHVE